MRAEVPEGSALKHPKCFPARGTGIRSDMTPEQFPDAVPDADAVEQSRDVQEPVLDDEAAVTGRDNPPPEAAAHDWLEQTADVEIDADEDDFGRDA